MAGNEVATPEAATIRYTGPGPINTISSGGEQVNNTITGGSGGTQYNATHQYFHSIRARDQDFLNVKFRKILYHGSPKIDRTNLIDTKGGIVSDTCGWILTTAEYKTWLKEGTQQLLWIWGGPGKGKTMLSIYISQKLEEQGKTIYFFCSAEDEKRNNAVSVLRGLLWHLTEICAELTQALRERFEPVVEASLFSRETLWTEFEVLVKAAQSVRLYCIVDGLDECDDDSQQWLARKLSSLKDSSDAGDVKVIILSRELVDLRNSFQLKLDHDYSEQVNSAVKTFVEARAEELFDRLTISDMIRNRIIQELLAGSQGSFLWVGFAMIDLLKQKNENGVVGVLGKLPTGLFPLYDRMLRNIKSDERGMSLNILGFVALASRPLLLDELTYVVQCSRPQSSPPIAERKVQDMIENCGPLFHVNNKTVSLVHESARGYTKTAGFRNESGSKPQEVHLRLAWACINALTQETLEIPFAEYAAEFWPHHARKSETLANELISHPSSFFDTDSRWRSRWWMETTIARMYMQRYYVKDIPRLHIASFLGLNFWIEDILKKRRLRFGTKVLAPRDRITKRDYHGRTALHWAILGDQEAAAKLLLDRRGLQNVGDVYGMSPLHLAAEEGHETLIKLLIDHKASIDLSSIEGKTPLHYAATGGHQTIAKLLIDYGANVRFVDSDHRSALRCAVESGKSALVKLLLDHEANANSRGPGGDTVLHSAARYDVIAKLLLDHGADANATDGINATVLHTTAGRGVEPAVKLLLEYGADINATDGNGETVLHTAVRGYHQPFTQLVAIVELLLEHKVDVDTKDSEGKTALMDALRKYNAEEDLSRWSYTYTGRTEALQTVMRILVEHGAQFDAESENGKEILRVIGEAD